MLGATIGDIVGSRFEFNNYRETDFELFHKHCDFTDDSICTAAIADWILRGGHEDLSPIMQQWCRRYPSPVGAYGARFAAWIRQENPQAYNSWGNGSAMRVSAVGWAFSTLEETLNFAEKSASITHNHPEGIKGAQAVAAAIFWARNGKDKTFIRQNIEVLFGYDLNKSCDEIRANYVFNESCQGTVPQAITAFLESENFEHAIRLAVSLGGDSDTLAAITGSIAEAAYPIPDNLRKQALNILPVEIAEILLMAGKTFKRKNIQSPIEWQEKVEQKIPNAKVEQESPNTIEIIHLKIKISAITIVLLIVVAINTSSFAGRLVLMAGVFVLSNVLFFSLYEFFKKGVR